MEKYKEAYFKELNPHVFAIGGIAYRWLFIHFGVVIYKSGRSGFYLLVWETLQQGND